MRTWEALDPDQLAALRSLQAAFGEVEVLDQHPNANPNGTRQRSEPGSDTRHP